MKNTHISSVNKAAQQLGRLGGKKTSEAKARASRENGKRGGRPKIRAIKGPGREMVFSHVGVGGELSQSLDRKHVINTTHVTYFRK
jgi:hypothetical protein